MELQLTLYINMVIIIIVSLKLYSTFVVAKYYYYIKHLYELSESYNATQNYISTITQAVIYVYVHALI